VRDDRAVSWRRSLRTLAQRGLLVTADRLNYYLVGGMTRPIDNRSFLVDTPWRTSTNMVRCAVLELCSREIHRFGVPGDIAEVGVGEGGTASVLNHHFADRKLLLFDTFTGFDARDLAGNRELGLEGAPYPLTPMPAERVLAALARPEQAEVHPGWFPASAVGLEDRRFALAHVDVGLYRPTLAALRWFSGRVSHRGYILVADYEHRSAVGVGRAVRQHAEETGTAYVVLPDRSGTAVFAV
jgi:O-methyltransferase